MFSKLGQFYRSIIFYFIHEKRVKNSLWSHMFVATESDEWLRVATSRGDVIWHSFTYECNEAKRLLSSVLPIDGGDRICSLCSNWLQTSVETGTNAIWVLLPAAFAFKCAASGEPLSLFCDVVPKLLKFGSRRLISEKAIFKAVV